MQVKDKVVEKLKAGLGYNTEFQALGGTHTVQSINLRMKVHLSSLHNSAI